MGKRIEMVFAAFGFVMSVIVLIALACFFGPHGKTLPLTGITTVFHLAAFSVVSTICGWLFSHYFFRDAINLGPFAKGCLTVASGFLVCVAVHFLLVLIDTDVKNATAEAFAAFVFGGLAFGLPAMLAGGMIGYFWHVQMGRAGAD